MSINHKMPAAFNVMRAKGNNNNRWKPARLTWQAIIALRTNASTKDGQHWIVYGRGRDKRAKDNMLDYCCLALDYDGEQAESFEKAVKLCRKSGLACWLYTTWSYVKGSEECFRVVVPSVAPVPVPSLRAAVLAVAAALGLPTPKSESWTPALPMYLPRQTATSVVVPGSPFVFAGASAEGVVADLPHERMTDAVAAHPIVAALQRAGLLLGAAKEKGSHYFTCPFDDQHKAHNPTQTIFYPPRTGGYEHWAVDCKDTAPDDGDNKHLTKESLKRWLVEHGHISKTAARKADERWDSRTPAGSLGKDLELVMVQASTVEPENIDWLWTHRIPRGMVTLLVGEGGMGKGNITTDVVARVTTGNPWPDEAWTAEELYGGKAEQHPPAAVIWFTAEDATAQILVPRLMAAGADLARVHFVEAVRSAGDTTEEATLFNLEENIAALRKALAAHPDVGLLVFDPITAFLFGASGRRTLDMNNATHLRSVLMPLKMLAEETNVAVWGLTHLTKDEGRNVVHRILGSGAWVHIARKVFGVGQIGTDTDGERAMVELKKNIDAGACALVFTIEGSSVFGSKRKRINTSRTVWDREDPTISVNTLWGKGARGPLPAVHTAACGTLREHLRSAGGSITRKELEAWATAQQPRISPHASSRAIRDVAVWDVKAQVWKLPAPVKKDAVE